MSTIRNLAKSLSQVVNKRQRLKSESALHQNSPADISIYHRLSERRVSAFDDTWIRPYAAGIARLNDMNNLGKFEEQAEHLYDNSENEKDDLDSLFQLSPFDQSRDELDEPNYINYENKTSDVKSVVSGASDDEISLYCDALSRKSSFVRTRFNAPFRYNLNP